MVNPIFHDLRVRPRSINDFTGVLIDRKRSPLFPLTIKCLVKSILLAREAALRRG